MGTQVFNKHLRERRAIKVTNLSAQYDQIEKTCQSCQKSHVSAITLSCEKDIIKVARKKTKLPIFISSIHPFEILKSMQFEIDGIEIGNFQNKDKEFTFEQIYDITLESLSLINEYDVFKCVNIPKNLTTQEQIKLIKKLEYLGVDLVQLENFKTDSLELFRSTTLPICISVNSSNIKPAFNLGANAIELNYTNKEITQDKLTIELVQAVGTISYRNSINKEIIKTTI